MDSQTRENINKKRRLRSRRRRLKLVRLLVFLFLVGSLGAAMLFVGYHVYSFGNRLYQNYELMYQGYEQRQAARRGALDSHFDGYTNVLVMGIDDGVDRENTPGQRADALFLFSLDHMTGNVRIVSIPRDTMLSIPGRPRPERVTDAYAYGGAPLTVQAVAGLLGISIHQYITLDMEALSELVDALGGIDLYVEDDMNYEDPAANLSIHLRKGYQHMDGATAQQYLRYRGSELGDVGRVQRQQHFVKAMYEKVLQLDTLTRLPKIADVFQHRMTTSAEIFDSAHLAKVLKSVRSSAPQAIMLPGESGDGVWIPNQNAIDEKMKEFFPASLDADTAGE